MLHPLINAAWGYRGFIKSSVQNEFRARLARSRLGAIWVVLQPLAQVLIFALILSNVLAARLPGVENTYAYAVYLMSGILCWNLFAEIMQRFLTMFIDSAPLLRKVQFPRIVLPLIGVSTALVTNLVLLSVMLVIFPLLGFLPNTQWLWLPLLILLTAALASGIGLLLGTLNVFARDIGHVMAVIMQFWFWVTPIVYPVSIVPAGLRPWLSLNPVMPLVNAYQDVIVYGRHPSGEIWYIVILAATLLLTSLFVFRRAAAELVDVI